MSSLTTSAPLHNDEHGQLRARIAELELQLAAYVEGRVAASQALPAEPRLPMKRKISWRDTPLEHLFNILPDLIFVIEREEMRISFCNDRFARDVGFADRAAVQGRTIYECFSASDAETFAAQNNQVFQKGETLHVEERITLPAGTHYFDTYKVPIADAEGKIVALLGSSRNITDLVRTRQTIEQLNQELERAIIQRRAIEELRERDAWLLSQVRDAVIVTDLDDRIIYWNAGAHQLFGWPAEEMIGKHGYGRESSSIDQAHRAELDQISNTAEFIGEVYAYCAGGRRWVESRVRPIFDQLGQRIGRMTLAHDIDPRKQAEAELRAMEERYRLIAENTDDLVVLLDEQTCFLYVSPSVRHLLGLEPVALLGQPGFARVHPDDLANVLESWAKVELSGMTEVSFRYQHENGSWRWFDSRGRLVQQGQRQYAVIIGRDITERRKLNDQLIQSQKMEGIGRLAGGVAHDFNNLLVVITGGVELARSLLAATHPAQVELDEIQRASERAARLTRQLLTFARRQASEAQLLDLSALLRTIEPMLRRLLREDIRLSLRLASGLWPVLANQGQLEQVVVNLVVNAQDAMPDGGLLEIQTENRALGQLTDGDQPAVTMTVSDSGVGMNEEILSHVFEPFFTTKPLGQGTGLGLATCYGIVTQHGGMIRIMSQPVQGTQVLASFPRASGAVPTQSVTPLSLELPPGSEQLLLVEDEPAVRQLIARVLRGQGYQVYEAENGSEALKMIEDGVLARIDLLLTDLVMPVMGGRELAQRLAARMPTLKILFVSGYAADERLSLNSFYAAAFLAKPFSPAILAHKVRELLDS